MRLVIYILLFGASLLAGPCAPPKQPPGPPGPPGPDGSGLTAYGELYKTGLFSDIPQTISPVVLPFAGFDTVNPSHILNTVCVATPITGPCQVTLLQAGTYTISLSVSWAAESNIDLRYYITVNGTIVPNFLAQYTTTGPNIVMASGGCILNLNAGDIVAVAVQSNTSFTALIRHANLNLERIN